MLALKCTRLQPLQEAIGKVPTGCGPGTTQQHGSIRAGPQTSQATPWLIRGVYLWVCVIIPKPCRMLSGTTCTATPQPLLSALRRVRNGHEVVAFLLHSAASQTGALEWQAAKELQMLAAGDCDPGSGGQPCEQCPLGQVSPGGAGVECTACAATEWIDAQATACYSEHEASKAALPVSWCLSSGFALCSNMHYLDCGPCLHMHAQATTHCGRVAQVSASSTWCG